MITNFDNYINESLSHDFKVGDEVIVKEGYDFKEFDNKVGEVIFIESDSILVKFNTRFSEQLHDGNTENYIDVSRKSRWFYPTQIELYDPIKLEKRLKRKEEMRLKYLDIDPYGEEDWDY